MNIIRAKRNMLDKILERLGITRQHLKRGPSKELIAAVCNYLANAGESATEADARRWIKNMAGQAPRVAAIVPAVEITDEEKSRFVERIQEIQNPLLISHLEGLGINETLAARYLKQIKICNRNNRDSFFALGFANENKGWTFYNPFVEGFVGKRYISFIRGTRPKPDNINIFKTDRDFMCAIAAWNDGRPLIGDSIILNCYSNLPKVTPYIAGYGYRAAFSWMDNDPLGMQATTSLNEFFKTQENLIHMPMNPLYAQHGGVIDWNKEKIGLTK